MKRRHTPGARAAFTIVELLVAMALIIFIMYIIAEAFAAGTSAFRNLKAIGDMNERLRSATGTLRRFLTADHFDGRRRLSDPDFWNNGPPQEGFFRIIQSKLSVNEGNDLDGIPSFQSNTQGLHFTVKLRGNNRADFFRASVPNVPTKNVSPLLSLPFADSRFQDNGGGLYCSPAAEIAVFLRATGVQTDDPDSTTGNKPQNLYTMYFRQRLLVPDNDVVRQAEVSLAAAQTRPANWPVPYNQPPNFSTNWRNYLEVSAIQDPVATNSANMIFNNLQDVTMPGRRCGQFTIDTNTGLINASNLPDNSSPSTANPISADGDLQVSFFPTGGPPAVRNNVYPRLLDDDPTQGGNDVLLTNVLSCQMGVLLDNSAYLLYTPTTAPATTPPPTFTNNPNAQPFDFIELSSDMMTPYTSQPVAPRIFDTWSNRKDEFFDYTGTNPPMFTYRHPTVANHPLNGTRIRVRAIQIRLRIWDNNTKQSRMTSVVVDL